MKCRICGGSNIYPLAFDLVACAYCQSAWTLEFKEERLSA